MGYKILVVGLFCIFFAYYIYTPLPENIEEPWKVAILDTLMRISILTATLFDKVGLIPFEDSIFIALRTKFTQPVSDENLTVIDTDFGDIPVRLYLPKRMPERQKPAVIFIHGGAFVVGSCKFLPYDTLCRQTASTLNAVVMGLDYRLAPQYTYPAAHEDCSLGSSSFSRIKFLRSTEWIPLASVLQETVLGGSLVAAVMQELKNDPEFKGKIKAQALLYPSLQYVDTLMPSYRENKHGPFLTRSTAIKLVSLYIDKVKELPEAVMRNEYMPQESRHLFKFLNWSDFLPEKFKKNHVYTEPILGKLNASYPALMDTRLSPLLVPYSQLQNLPLTYILTCQYDIVRDDGLIYVTRLRNAGVQVTHDHIEDGFHGALSFITEPFILNLGIRIRDKYISWLKENL